LSCFRICLLSLLLCIFLFSLYYSVDHLHLHSFPTRRSSDLSPSKWSRAPSATRSAMRSCACPTACSNLCAPRAIPLGRFPRDMRSEEHTSELQSHLNLVCRLLLEKKKKERRKLSITTVETKV